MLRYAAVTDKTSAAAQREGAAGQGGVSGSAAMHDDDGRINK